MPFGQNHCLCPVIAGDAGQPQSVISSRKSRTSALHLDKYYLEEISSLKKSNMKLQVILEETGKQLAFSLDGPFIDKESQLAIGERVELALSRSHFKAYNAIHLRFEIVQGERIIQTMPGYGSLFVDLDETYAKNWFV